MQKEIKQSVKCCRAFTLVELILVVGTIGMVSGALVGVVGNSYKDFKAGSDRSTLLQDGQAVIDQMVRTLRQAKAFVAVSASTDQAGYITYTSADDVSEQFKLNTQRRELEYGPPASLSALTGDVSSLTFTCYDTNGVALTGAVEPNSVKSVQIAMTLAGTQNTVTLTARVYWPKDRQVISPDTGPQYTYPGSENRHYTLPVAWYKLDDIVIFNDDFVLDWSGNGNHGTFKGETEPNYTTGKFGQAIELDGANDRVEYIIPNGRTFATYTVALWAKAAKLGQAKLSGVFNCKSGASDFQIDVDGTNPGKYRYRSGTSNQNNKLIGTVTTNWVHLAVTCNGTDTKVYYNGTHKATISNEARTEFGQYTIGRNRGNNVYFAGDIDDLRVYDAELTATDIADVFAGKAVGSPVVWWKFDDDDLVLDSSGNANHGTLTSSPAVVPGRIGNAYSFDGEDDYVEYVFPEEVTFDAYTVTLWARADTLGQGQYTGLFNSKSGGDDFQIDVDGTNPGNYRYRSNAKHAVFGTVIEKKWVHLAVTCDGTNTKVYYNGTYKATISNESPTKFGRYVLGKNRGDHARSTHYFDGTIDDLRIYDVALSGPEIAALYLEWKEGALD